MKRIRFVREGSLLSEMENFKWLKELPVEYVKETLAKDGKPSSLFVLNNLQEFEQYCEYEFESSYYGAIEVIISIHFISKRNFASYLTMECSASHEVVSKMYDNNIVQDVHKTFRPKHDWRRENTEVKAKIIELETLKSLSLKVELDNYKKGWSIKDDKYKNDIFYISDDVSFCVPISEIIWRLYQALPNEQKVTMTEDERFHADLENGIVGFSFGWESHSSRKSRNYTGFSGRFSLMDFSGSINNTGSSSYFDYGVT